MVEGNIASLGLFLMILTISLGLIMFNMSGSVKASCEDRFSISSDLNNNSYNENLYNNTINQYNNCVAEGFPNWLYIIFITPFGVMLALIIKKLAFI
jgi:hypothetical protein